MTTGSIVQELEPFPRGNCGGTYYFRRYYRKAWNGSDLSAAEKLAGRPFPAHPYTLDLSVIDRGEVIYNPLASHNLFANCFGGGTNPGLDWSANDELKLLGKLGSLVRGHDFNAGIFLGTGHQTVNLIHSNAQRIAYGLIALKKGLGPKAILSALAGAEAKRIRTPRSASKQSRLTRKKLRGRQQSDWQFQSEHRDVELSRRWLEVSYGWMPLLSDVYEATIALGNHVQKVSEISFRARYKPPSREKSTEDSYRRLDEKVQNRAQLVYTLSREKDFILEMAGLGLMDPASVVWELVPWSFVIDWFIPVGAALENAALIPRLKGKWVRTFSRRTWSKGQVIHPLYTHVRDYTSYSLYVDRTTGSTPLGVPLPEFKSPMSKSWKRALNQVSLLGTLRARH